VDGFENHVVNDFQGIYQQKCILGTCQSFQKFDHIPELMMNGECVRGEQEGHRKLGGPSNIFENLLAGMGIANFLVIIPFSSIARSESGGFLVRTVLGDSFWIMVVGGGAVSFFPFAFIVAWVRRMTNCLLKRIVFVISGLVLCSVILRTAWLSAEFNVHGYIAVKWGMALCLGGALAYGLWRIRMDIGLRTMVLLSPLFLVNLGQISASLANPIMFSAPMSSPQAKAMELPDVHLITLDEVALKAILSDNALDRRIVPNLAAFAGEATWFRNAAANANITAFAVPSLLSGGAALTPNDLPDTENLVALLESRYRVQIVADISFLCPNLNRHRYQCVDYPDYSSSMRVSPSELWMLLGQRYLFQVTPVLISRVFFDHLLSERVAWEGHSALARQFLVMLPAPGDPPTFNYFHSLLTHEPWIVRADSSILVDSLAVTPMDQVDPLSLADLLTRYREAILYADGMMGNYLRLLKISGRYDKALIILTSDHGVSFDPRQPGRAIGHANEWIVRIPLIIKFPGQIDGKIVDAPVSNLDLLRTILDVVGLSAPASASGVSLFDNIPLQRSVRFASVANEARWRSAELFWFAVDVPRGIYEAP
jgi:hypothetical protein